MVTATSAPRHPRHAPTMRPAVVSTFTTSPFTMNHAMRGSSCTRPSRLLRRRYFPSTSSPFATRASADAFNDLSPVAHICNVLRGIP